MVKVSTSLSPDIRADAEYRAQNLVEQLRNDSDPGLMEKFLGEYGLSTEEGVALMCLAEALLRVPDAETMDALIEDKIAPSKWGEHLNKSSSALVNASTWGLMLTGKVLDTDDSRGVVKTLRNLVKRMGEPVIRTAVRQAMREMGKQFVLGEDIKDALKNRRSGYRYSFDMLGEAAISTPDARRYESSYLEAAKALTPYCNSSSIHDNPGISVKLSALHPRYETLQSKRVMAELLPRLKGIATVAAEAGMGLNIDAEEADRLDLSLDIFEALARDPDLAGWDGLGLVVQAYGLRAGATIDWVYALAKEAERHFMIRLVKGAYWDGEIKHAQVGGHAAYPVFETKSETDRNYALCAKKLLSMRDRLYPQFATHNALTTATVLALAGEDKSGFEFQRLHGMGDALHEILRKETGLPCRIYAPVGIHKDLLAYLVRRLLENGANSSFVSQITDKDVPIEAIIADPFETQETPIIGKPEDIFYPRKNSRGWNLNDPQELEQFLADRAAFETKTWTAKPQIAKRLPKSGPATHIINPANGTDTVGTVTFATEEQAATAFAGAKPWDASPYQRAKTLREASNALEARHAEIFALLAREAGKTAADAVAELREAVDFLRYYADEAEMREGTPRGTIVTIAPWNFPLAIFLGQIGAALASGNSVIAKPAEATPLIAGLAVDILHEAGVPKTALQNLPGEGATVGAALTSDPRADGVVFTGSTATAKIIHKSVAENLSPEALFIAETGGINCMVVDSTALPQQAVNDVIASAFQSAGQRCSALRVLYLQEDIYEPTLKMLCEAMDELKLGEPWLSETDVGPVIDEAARAKFSKYIAGSDVIHQSCDLPDTGHFIQPTLLRVEGRKDVTQEIFGPVLHVIKFDPDDLDDILEDINDRNYALTFGLHTRIDNRVDEVTKSLRVGNIYVNRNQIGAVVGSQPFGGSGLSGTGPKAGGPDYLPRFFNFDRVTLPEETQNTMSLKDAQAVIDAAPSLPFHPLHTLDCPGPTGESNRLTRYARGKILCLGPDVEEQMLLVEGAGGRGVALPGLDPDHLEQLTGFAAVVRWSEEAERRASRIALARRDGPILPLATTRDVTWAVTTEVHVCIDTTASGGNAALLAGEG
ncbi:bifunctional proline dehydrogenase/L-glutamate gamma-semialdehyde dehydrogenase PutA [Litorimonas sp. WD9-15]|uniref:bifunctional proline dehydrogenase/L-glutamate gamma-semialdehyde dehydrogenase PutA n=1 Tax=Litorimonas sp. WD9-15 TaxID=3418716 RepID=UPI003CFFD56A